MGSSVGFYCAGPDHEALVAHAQSIGLVQVPPRTDKLLNPDPEQGPYCYLSLVPLSDLHPCGDPPVQVTDAKDPVIGFMRAYFKDPYLVAGHIHWSNDVAALAVLTRPKFQELSKWIRQKWEWLPAGGFYIGPAASKLLGKGAKTVNVFPVLANFNIVCR